MKIVNIFKDIPNKKNEKKIKYYKLSIISK